MNKYHSSLKNSIINVGRIEEWSRFVGGSYETSETIGIYRVELKEEDQDIRMFIWSKTKPCINIVLSKEDNIGVIDGIYYNPTCTINGIMKRGEGTKKMLTFAIKYIKKRGAKKILLSDNSTIICNDKHVRLGPMYFLKFGMTWYEKHFGFKPTDEYAKKYEEAKEKQKALILSEKPCDYFTNEVIDNHFNTLKLSYFYKIAWQLNL